MELLKRRTTMINLKKNDAIADAVRDIMEKELKGNQTKLDKNHNGKLDSQDFKILRGQKKATEDVEQIDELKKSTLASYAKKAGDESSYYSFAAGSRSAKDPQRLISDKLAMKRQSGANKAIDRLSKESTDVNDRSEDTLAGRIKTKKKDDVGPGADFKSTKVDMKSEETVEENAFDYKSPRQPEPNGGSGVKQGSRYGGSKQKEKPEQEMPKEKNEDVEHIDEKNWIAGAIKHPGAETAAAKRAGMSVQAYASKHQHDSGTSGKRARLAMTLKKMKENYEESIVDELINEVLSKDASAGDWIHDFVHSDNPKFAGKSKAERKKMALGAYYGKKNEEVNEGLKSVAKKAFKALTGGSDEDQRKDLQRKMGVPQTGQKPKTEEVKPPVHYGGKGTEGAKFDLYMQKRKQDNAKAAPKTQKEEVESIEEGLMTGITLAKKVKNDEGGHDQDVHHKGKKIGTISSYSHRTGTKYGMSHDASGDAMAGSRSHEEALSDLRQAHAEHLKSMKSEEVVMEGRTPVSSPGMDTPFVTDGENKPLGNAKELAAKTMKRMKNEMLGKTGTSE